MSGLRPSRLGHGGIDGGPPPPGPEGSDTQTTVKNAAFGFAPEFRVGKSSGHSDVSADELRPAIRKIGIRCPSPATVNSQSGNRGSNPRSGTTPPTLKRVPAPRPGSLMPSSACKKQI